MKTDGLNLTHINDTVIDLYIVPSNDWHLEKADFNMSTLNFTWHVVNYTGDTLDIKITFNAPIDISPRKIQD